MDFKGFKASLKKNAILVKDKTKAGLKKAVEKGGEKLESTKIVIKNPEELKALIEKSEETTSEVTDNGIVSQKKFKHKVMVIFAEKKSTFYQDALFLLPMLYAKTWSQGVVMKLCDIDLKDLKDYNIKSFPTMVVFQDKIIYKTIEGEEKIKKIVKGFSLDINKEVDKG